MRKRIDGVSNAPVHGETTVKSNDAASTLRRGKLPNASKVEEVNEDANDGLCKKLASQHPEQ